MERSLGSAGRSVLELQFNSHFHAADQDKDKLLNFDEYIVFNEKEKASRMLRREPEIEKTKE